MTAQYTSNYICTQFTMAHSFRIGDKYLTGMTRITYTFVCSFLFSEYAIYILFEVLLSVVFKKLETVRNIFFGNDKKTELVY